MANVLTEWLGIPADELPPNHYRLLGLKLFEADPEVVSAAAEKTAERVRKAAGRGNMETAGKLLSRIKAARVCLMNDASRAGYNSKLRADLGLNAGSAGDAPAIETGPPETAAERAKKSGSNSTLWTVVAAVAGGAVAVAIFFSGLLPIGPNSKQAEAERNQVARNDDGNPDGDNPENDKPGGANTPDDERVNNAGGAPDNPKRPDPQVAANQSGNLFLSDLKPVEVTLHNEVDSKFTVNEVQPKHGVRLHPAENEGFGRVSYNLDGKQRWLQGLAVVPDSSPESRTLLVTIYCDGKLVWESQALKNRGDREEFLLDVSGVKKLEFKSRSNTERYEWGHVALFDPRLSAETDKPEPLQIAGVTDSGRDVAATTPVAADDDDWEPIDLLKKIDPAKHTLNGTWKFEGGELVTEGTDEHYIQIPVDAPAEYELRIVATRPPTQAPSPRLILGIVGGGRHFNATFDQQRSQNGLYCLDNVNLLRNNQSFHRAAVFQDGQPSEIVCRVTRSGVSVTVNGKQNINWEGDFSRLRAEFSPPDPRQLAIRAEAPYRFSKLELRPIEKPQVVDLLKKIDPQRDAVVGEWAHENGALSTPGSVFSQLTATSGAPEEYELHLTVARTKEPNGYSWFGLALQHQGRQFWAFLDFDRSYSGLSRIDGIGLRKTVEARKHDPIFQVGVKSNVVCRVDRRGVNVTVDGKPYIEWRGDFQRLSLPPGYRELKDKQLAVGSFSAMTISRFELRDLKRPQVDLLKKIDPETHSVGPKWSIENGGLLNPDADKPKIRLSDEVPPEYKLRFRIERISGGGGMFLGLPVNGRQIACFIDSDGRPPFTAVGTTSSGAPERKGAHQGLVLNENKPVDVEIDVESGKLSIRANSKLVYEWKGDPADLQIHNEWKIPQEQSLYIGTGAGTRFRITELTLIPADPDPDADPSETLLAIPDKAAQQKALALVKEIYEKEYAEARQPDKKKELARKLLDQGRKTTKDSAGRYVLFVEARNLAIASFASEIVLESIDELSQSFEFDPLHDKAEAFKQMLRDATTVESRRELAGSALLLAEEALEARRFAPATSLVGAALAAANRIRDAELRRDATELRAQVFQSQRRADAAEDARAKLQDDPDDGDANETLGRYLAFVEKDWTAALPHLKKSSNAELAAVAGMEGEQPTDGEGRAALGDAWVKLAKQAANVHQPDYRSRAAHWYRQAVEQLEGLAKARVAKEIERLDRQVSAGAASSRRTRGKRAALGMIGRCRVDKRDVGAVFKYTPEKFIKFATVRDLFGKRGITGGMKFEFVGIITLKKPMELTIEHRGGSAAGGVHRLYINNHELGAVGDDRTKATSYNITLRKGSHFVKWELSGGDLGNSRIGFTDAKSKLSVPVYYTRELLQVVRRLPTKWDADLSE